MRKSTNIIKVTVYTFLKIIFTILTKALFFTRVYGRDNLPKKGPFIIAANHSSFADAALIGLSMPRFIRWITRKDVYNIWFMKPFHKLFGSIIINGSVEEALKVLKEGEVVGVFPEGTRSYDGSLMEGDIGVAVIAIRSGSPVVPIGISGIFKAYGRHKKFPTFYPVLVKIGRPITSLPRSDKIIIDNGILRKTTDHIMSKIKELIVDI